MTEFFSGKNVLITGGAGFIGSNLAIRLVEMGARVTLIDSLVPEYGGNLFNLHPIQDKVRINISDVRDVHSFRALVTGQDVLFNLAGQTSHLDSMDDPFTDLEINCRAQLSILEACRHQNPGIRIVFAGTRQVYGRPLTLPVDEQHPVHPVDINGIHKLAGENYHLLYHQVCGLRTSCLRLTNTIGPRMRIKDSRQTFVGVWIRHLLENVPIEVWGGGQMRDFNDVEDVVDAVLICAAADGAVGRIFNLGGKDPITLDTLAAQLTALQPGGVAHTKPYPAFRRAIDIGDYYGCYASIQAALGWEPRRSLESTLRRTLAYYREYFHHYV